MKTKYKYNIGVFDYIDSPEKAYWIGFIWSDGYVMKRQRKYSMEYSLKLSLAKQDFEHLEKFIKFMDSDLPIYEYKNNTTTSFKNSQNEVRVLINSTKFGKKLYDDFGIFSFRNDPNKTISKIPKEFYKYFIMGVLDADGSFTYYLNNGKVKSKKSSISFQSVEKLILFIQDYFYEIGLIETKQKYHKRHENRDGDSFGYKICGNMQVQKILDFMYNDDEVKKICLKRKYDKYKELKEFLK